MPGQFVTIDRLWSGISGQAPWQRKTGTIQAGINLRFDPRLGGGVSRNPTELVLDLLPGSGDLLDPTAVYFWTNIRGSILAIGIGGLTASASVLGWDEFGAPLEIIDNTSGGFDTYLDTVVDPVRDIDVTTSFDTLIVCNRKVNTGATSDVFTFIQSFNLIKNGDETQTDAIQDLTDDSVQFFSELDDLPASADGDVHHVLADENLDPAGFYVFFAGVRHADFPLGFFPAHGEWYRIPDGRTPQASGRYTDTLMPHRIVYDESAETITLDTCPWRQRISGNQASNEVMLFENRRIVSVEFFNGRLFVIGDNSINASRKNDFFNLWKYSVNAPRDDDSFSQLITQSDVGEALRAKTCGAALFIMAENGQLQFGSTSENLTNVNGILETITDLPSQDIDLAAGPTWISMLDAYGDIHQYVWSGQNRNILYEDMLTAHVPDLFPDKTVDRIFQFGTTFVAVVNDDDAQFNDIFVVGGQRIQSAWGAFETFETPVFFNSWQGNIRVITGDATEGFSLLHYVHRKVPAPTGMSYIPRTDRQEIVPIADMTYDGIADETTVPHTGRDGVAGGASGATVLVTRDAGAIHEFVLPARINSDGDPVFPGKRNSTSQFLGFLFRQEMELSKVFGQDPRAFRTLGITAYHFDTTNYSFITRLLSGQEHTDVFQAVRVDHAVIGEVVIGTGLKKFGVTIDPRTTTIIIRSDTPGQMNITRLDYELRREGQASEV